MRFLRRFSILVLLPAALAISLFGLELLSWQRLTHEAPVARVRFEALGPQRYRVELRDGDFCQPRYFELAGDEWRLDARFLKWKPWANLLGLDAHYRLERISGRYRDIDEENRRPHQAYALAGAGAQALIDGWLLDTALSPLDTEFGSSVYEAMDPDRVYTVYRSQSGLLVRSRPAMPVRQAGRLVIPIEPDCS